MDLERAALVTPGRLCIFSRTRDDNFHGEHSNVVLESGGFPYSSLRIEHGKATAAQFATAMKSG